MNFFGAPPPTPLYQLYSVFFDELKWWASKEKEKNKIISWKKKSDKNHLIESKMTINRQYDHKFKFMMLGDAGVGKTSIARCGSFPFFNKKTLWI